MGGWGGCARGVRARLLSNVFFGVILARDFGGIFGMFCGGVGGRGGGGVGGGG